MDINEAKELLGRCVREELRDHAFGDVEIYWTLDGVEVAMGYFGSGQHDGVTVHPDGPSLIDDPKPSFSFEGADGRSLRSCGRLGKVERNDETGPDEFRVGKIAPGLTLGDVWKELTTPPRER